jgi:AcrR family transcriptional regulator
MSTVAEISGRKADTRTAILARAVDLASAEGLDGLTIGRLATELKMSKSGLFGHFGSKLDLQLATVKAAAERFFIEVIEPALDHPEGEARLRALAGSYLGHLERDVYSGGCFWVAVSAEYDDRPGPVHDAIRGALDAWIGDLERQLTLAGAERPDQLAFELYALTMGANSRFRLTGDRRVIDQAREAIESLMARVPA